MTAQVPMISFACQSCQRPFNVPANFAGRKATCKTCGAKVVVPGDAPAPSTNRIAPAGSPTRAASESPIKAPTSAESTASVATADTNGNGKARVAVAAPMPKAPAAKVSPSGEAAVPTADPATPVRRAPRVAIISEAQSAPSALIVPSGALVVPPAQDGEKAAVAERKPRPGESPTRAAAPSSAPAKLPMRVRRLMADAEQMTKLYSGDGPICIKSTVGDPAETYQIEYNVTSLQRGWLGKPKKRDTHLVEIQLTSEYPRVSPQCKMLTPVFHPNIDESTICVGDHWTAGERLVDLVVRIGEMLAYQAYNIKSPLNGEAAMWADLHPDKLPVDSRNFHSTDDAA